ncbi:uncharacterized protein LOC132737722 isoform X2 [Ruditapes philippinarum]|uniref:uncharacterized protein LOC132737722 isoform X2 n=1 Tax=Ruditapes philippinarum TaxID=129788 RepID=UPI00295B1132|nr:uncharacterized protein LOC132737722 isoform X2 [Ruditapes philippinarum]
MGTLVESDIDQFIRGHKTKLQEEKVHLNQYTDQSRYPGGQDLTSPSGRKQWDRNNAQGARPAEERRAPVEPEETGLLPQNNDIERRKHQLQSERQQEYNEYIAKRGPGGRRRPRTPAEQGLPLGTYENRRKDLAAERQKEMQQALELKKKQQSKRHIVTPEQGMFVGPDQRDRDQQIREKNRKNRLALEEVYAVK